MSRIEIPVEKLNTAKFIAQKINTIRQVVGQGTAISALSGGVDSSVVTMLGHLALGKRLKTFFINNGLMRQNEPEEIVAIFKKLAVTVQIINAQNAFFQALKGISDPEKKREAVTQTFYRHVFGKLVRDSGAKVLLQGTILTDIDETAAGIKRQHNVFAQIGIDPQTAFGYQILEPLVQLRKDGVRKLAQALRLPASIYNRMPFPGPALAARVIGEVTPAKIAIVRQATAITEEEFLSLGAFQCLAILHHDRVTGMRKGKRDFGLQIEIRCWDTVDAQKAKPTQAPYPILFKLANRLVTEVPGVVSVTYNITPKPPSTMEAV